MKRRPVIADTIHTVHDEEGSRKSLFKGLNSKHDESRRKPRSLDCVVSRIVRRRAGFESNPCGNDVYKRMMCVFQCCENKRCGVSCGVVLNQQRRMVAVTWKGHCAVRTIDIYRKIMRVRGTWSSVRRAERNGACCLRSINLILAWERIFWHFGE